MPKVKMIYDQGSASIAEDGLIFRPPFYYGVIDGVSGAYLPGEGPRFFNGLSGGQLATHLITLAFKTAMPGQSLEYIILRANNMIRHCSEKNGLSMQDSAFLPSATFAVASIVNDNVTILQGGDSLALWRRKDGAIGFTMNQMYEYEAGMHQMIAGLMRKHKRNRKKMWEDFLPFMIERRRSCVNTIEGRFAVINGQPKFRQFWQKFELQLKEIDFLLLFSDGFVPFQWPVESARWVTQTYEKGGLHLILGLSRLVAQGEKSSTHEDFPEATAIAIEF